MPVNNLPPQNIEAEESVLGGILLDPGAIGVVEAILPPEAMYIPAHRDIYKVALELNAQGKPTDLMSVTSYLYDHELIDKIGGQSKLAQLVERTVSAVNVDRYARLIVEKWHKRTLIRAGNDIVQLGYFAPLDSEEAHAKAMTLIETVTPNSSSVESYSTLREIAESPDFLAESPSLPTSFDAIDRKWGGIQDKGIIIVAARPSMGKTALALQMAKAMAEESPIVFFSLEMSRKMLLLRLICGEAKVNTEKVRRGTMTADERERVNHATSRITDLPLIIFDDQKGKPTIPQMGAFLVKVEREYGKPKAFFLDHIGELVGGSEDDTANTSKAARALRAMRNKHDVTPIILSQLNRSCEARNNKRPTMSDLKNSGTLEEVGDMIFFLYRDEYYNPGGESAGQAELILAKYRDGETGTVILGFSEGVFHDRQTSNW